MTDQAENASGRTDERIAELEERVELIEDWIRSTYPAAEVGEDNV
jgi:hypothetical protein